MQPGSISGLELVSLSWRKVDPLLANRHASMTTAMAMASQGAETHHRIEADDERDESHAHVDHLHPRGRSQCVRGLAFTQLEDMQQQLPQRGAASLTTLPNRRLACVARVPQSRTPNMNPVQALCVRIPARSLISSTGASKPCLATCNYHTRRRRRDGAVLRCSTRSPLTRAAAYMWRL